MVDEARLDVSVVLPTYNESASLPVIVPRIAEALRQAGLRGEIVVVDDNSPDGTSDVARKLAESLPVRVEQRIKERGLATAVLAGFALSNAEVCVVMDADGSHPINALPEMVRMILADRAEIVVGSRHVEGGGSTDWPLFSQLKSRFAASLAIGLSGMTDPTTGYMAVRRSRLAGLKLDPVGWKIVLEIVVKAHPARLAEVPIVFADRELGESKQSLRVLEQYLVHLYKLYKFRFPALIELLKFCLVGVCGLFLDLAIVYQLKSSFALDTRLCQVFGFSAAVTFNYAINRRFSFEYAREAPLLRSYVAYVGANLVGLVVRMVAIHALMTVSQLDRGGGYLLLSVIGILLATLVNFVGVKYFAFAPDRPSETTRVRDSLPPQRTLSRPGTFAVLVCALALFVGLNLQGVFTRTHDEQVNVTMAENIHAGLDGLVHPSVTPGKVADWRAEALPHVGNTPVYPLLLSLVTPLTPHGYDLVSLGWFALLLVGAYLALAPIDVTAACAATLLLASSPAVLAQFARREFEPMVAALCTLGFAFAVRAIELHRPLLGLLAGAAIGLAFATKMWLFVPGLLACVGLFAAHGYGALDDEQRRIRWTGRAFASTCVLFALSHLAFVALSAPGDLDAWVEWVYLGLFSGHGVTAAKLSQDAASASSPWAYVGWLLRDHGALVAPLVLGLPAATRRMSRPRRALSGALVGALLSLVPLSVPVAKEPLYMAPVLPFLYALVALAVVAPDRTPARYARVNRSAAKLSLVCAAVLASPWLSDALLGSVTPALAGLAIAQLAIWCVPSLSLLARRSVSPVLLPCALCSLLVTLFAALAHLLGST